MISLEKYHEYVKDFDRYEYKVLTDENNYKGSLSKIDVEDNNGYRYSVLYQSFKKTVIKEGNGLNKFHEDNPFTLYNINKFLKENGNVYFLEDGQTYINSKTKLIFYDSEGYYYITIPFHAMEAIVKNFGLRKFDRKNPYTIQNISLWLVKNNKPFSLVEGQKFTSANEKLKYKCHKCHPNEEPFKASWGKIISGRGCSYCSSRTIGKYNNLKYLRPDISLEWDYEKNFPIRPEGISLKNDKKFYWICPVCAYSYPAIVSNRTRLNSGCPKCDESKGEAAVCSFLNNANIKYIQEHRFDDCKNKINLPFDFYLPEYNYCIEYQGIQHYKPIDFFGGEEAFESNKIRDEIKRKYCLNNKIKLIEIPYFKMDKIPDIMLTELCIKIEIPEIILENRLN